MTNAIKGEDDVQHYTRNGHSKNRMRCHIVFSTKWRRKSLLGIEDSVYEVLRSVEADSDFTIVAMAVDKGDHLHLVVKFKPSLSAEQVVRRLKSYSTYRLWEREAAHLKVFYWKRRVLWAKGYFVGTVGAVSESVVLDYVRNQAA